MTRPVVRARTVDDLICFIPFLLGFAPERSLVVACRTRAGRLGLVVRVDLPDASSESCQGLSADLARVVVRERPGSVLVLCFDDSAPDPAPVLPWTSLVQALDGRLAAAGVPVDAAVLVAAGRRWSYPCQGTDLCEGTECPPAGVPLPPPGVEVRRLAAELALAGAQVLPDRTALARSVGHIDGAGPSPAAWRAAEEQVSRCLTRTRGGAGARAGAGRLSGLVEQTCQRILTTVGALGERPSPWEPAAAAQVVCALRHPLVRDAVLTLVLEAVASDDTAVPVLDPAALLAVLVSLAQQVPDDRAAPICTVLAGSAYALGRGALANVALERATACEPDYALALLFAQLVDGASRPSQLVSVLHRVRSELQAVLREDAA